VILFENQYFEPRNLSIYIAVNLQSNLVRVHDWKQAKSPQIFSNQSVQWRISSRQDWVFSANRERFR